MTSDFTVHMDEYLPLREVVFNTLRQAILKGELKPGERLMEIALAEKLGVSRTPIREAMRKLELEGLVVMIPRRGAQDNGISLLIIMVPTSVRYIICTRESTPTINLVFTELMPPRSSAGINISVNPTSVAGAAAKASFTPNSSYIIPSDKKSS